MERSSFEGSRIGGAAFSCTLGRHVELNKASFTAFPSMDGRSISAPRYIRLGLVKNYIHWGAEDVSDSTGEQI